MNGIFKAYKFRLRPTKEQKCLLDKHFGSVRFVYNHFLAQRISQYETTKKSDSFKVQSAQLTGLKQEEETEWLREINSQSLQASLKNLETAYSRFFKGVSQFPKFKSKKDKNSFNVPQNISVEDGKIKVNKFREGQGP